MNSSIKNVIYEVIIVNVTLQSIKSIKDPEFPYSLEELGVIYEDCIEIIKSKLLKLFLILIKLIKIILL